MKLLGAFLALGVWPMALLAYAQATGGGGRSSAIGADETRFAEKRTSDVGVVTAVHAIAQEDRHVGEHLTMQLEADNRTTVVGQIEVGELLCDNLTDASDATLLQFAISSNETVTAERTSYTSYNGNVTGDGIERKVWKGTILDTEPGYPRAITIVWADQCEVKFSLLEIESTNANGSTAITKSFPCEAGSSTEFCMVKLSVVFNLKIEEEVLVDEGEQGHLRKLKESVHARGMRRRDGNVAIEPSGRGLQSVSENPKTVVVNVMVLYTKQAWSKNPGVSEDQLKSYIELKFVDSNDAMVNSHIDLELNLVHLDQAPTTLYDQYSEIIKEELARLKNDNDVNMLRQYYRADLVMLIAHFDYKCGLADFFDGKASRGFSIVNPKCLINHTHTHEIGHNFGCLHNKESSDTTNAEYSYGKRFCSKTGGSSFITIMSYPLMDCPSSRTINYFSNPDVFYGSERTGSGDKDNAQTIRDNMVKFVKSNPNVSQFELGVVSKFRDKLA